MIKAFIVDNEANIVAGLERLLAITCPQVEVQGSAASVKEAKALIPKLEIDVLFLDVELDDGTGMDLLKQLVSVRFQVIFITAYNQYAIEAFRFSALDFLLKPIDPDDLQSAVQKLEEQLYLLDYPKRLSALEKNLEALSGRKRKLIINDKQHIHAISVPDIYMLKAEGPYTHFHLADRYLLSSRNLKYYEDLLHNFDFERVHHSYLVNLSYMEKFEKSESVLMLSNGAQVPVSSRKREHLFTKLRELGLAW